MRFPLIGSVSLLTLFILFKLLPAEAVNFTLSFYFLIMGSVATTATLVPLFQHYFPEAMRSRRYGPYKPRFPNWLLNIIPSQNLKQEIASAQESWEMSASIPELVIGGMCSVLCTTYMMTKHWFFNNLLGLAFAIEGVEYLNITSTATGILLFVGLFFYDIFWVFCTPVMVTVATSFEAPIKLVFPHPAALAKIRRPYAMLGLGDIVIPGMMVSLVLRYDMSHHNGRTNFFTSALTGYAAGLITTTVVMNVFSAAQPALLYIVPGVLGFVLIHAAIAGELRKFVNHCAVKEHEENNEGQAAIEGIQPTMIEGRKDR